MSRRSPAYTEHRLVSDHRQLEYVVRISCPKETPPPGGYPVIYALDGDAVFGTLTEAARLQTRKPLHLDPAVIVAIAYPSGEPFDRNRRFYDFTTPAATAGPQAGLKQSSRPQPQNRSPERREWPETGGADAFLLFMESQLFPFVAELHPVNRDRQTLFGHSLGGLLTLYALFSRPHLFRHYIAGSPSIWWNDRELLQRLPAFETALSSDPALSPQLLITVGADELAHMVGDAVQLAERLGGLSVHGLHTSLTVFADENHVSVLPATVSRLLRYALTKPDRSAPLHGGRI